MKWTCEHRIDAPLARVEAVLLDPATLAAVPRFMPTIREVTPLWRTEGTGWIERVAHFVPDLRVRMPARITPEMLAFDERTRWDLATHAGTFQIHPAVPPRLRHRVRCGGTYTLLPDGDATVREIRGEIAIDAPVIGPWLEAAAVRIIHRQFDAEARMLGALAAR